MSAGHTAVDDLALLTRDGRRYPQVLPDRPASDARALMSTLLTGAAVQATLNAIARSHELIVGAAILTGIREKLISALESDS